MSVEKRERLPESFFNMTEEELKVIRIMGLPENVRDWTPEVIKGIYEKWEQEEQNGKHGAQVISEDALRAEVPFEIAHSVHDLIAAVQVWQSIRHK